MRFDIKAYRSRHGYFALLAWDEYCGQTTHGPPEYWREVAGTGCHATKPELVRDIRRIIREAKAYDRKTRAEWAKLM